MVLDSIIICNDLYDQLSPNITFGDSVYLVSWIDKRGLFPAIYCARVLPDGSVIETNGFRINDDSTNQISPVSSFDGNNFFVVWVGFDGNGFGVFGKRISVSGAILDSFPIVITYSVEAKYNPAMAYGGGNYMSIWDDARLSGTDYDEWAARISTEGILIDTAGIAVDTSPGYQFTPSVSFLPPYFFAVWTDDQSSEADLVGKRISLSGDVVDSVAIPISSAAGQQFNPSILRGIDKYCVAWSDGRLGYENSDIYATFVDTAGAVVEEEKISDTVNKEMSLTVNPNPFSTTTQIVISLSGKAQRMQGTGKNGGQIDLNIYGIQGNLVKSFSLFTPHSSLITTVFWDGTDNLGNEVPSGIYFSVFKDGGIHIEKKILLIK